MSINHLYPQGITLHTLGYSALHSPLLAPELPIPLANQVGVLQRIPNAQHQTRVMTQIASQYLPSLIARQNAPASAYPELHDPSNAQYWLSDPLVLLNYLSSQPDVAIRLAKEGTVLKGVVEKLLVPELEAKMRACDATRRMGATVDADLGSMLQFVSTLLLRIGPGTAQPDEVIAHPRLQELVPVCRTLERRFRKKFVGTVAERLRGQVEGGADAGIGRLVVQQQDRAVVCGRVGCDRWEGTLVCGGCRLQRYCGVEHQRGDWRFHKRVCNKGLVEEGEGVASSSAFAA